MRAELAYTEAAVRDRIRAPHLADPVLVDTVDRLRRRGVEVVVLGESGSAGSPASSALVGAITSGIAGVPSGRVTIRTFPPGRRAAASVVIATGEASEQLQFSAAGELVRRA